MKIQHQYHIVFAVLMTIGMIQALHSQAQITENKIATVDEIKNYFRHQGKTVITFTGYSGSGYQDEKSMLAKAKTILQKYNPAKTIINIGATPDGIGAVYALAKEMGFQTTGIVSIKAKENEFSLSPHADVVFYVEDTTWGGIIKETHGLSPTSQAMVENSDVMIGIGGGEIARDELLSAKKIGKKVSFYPADMNHQKAIESAKKQGLKTPSDFRGAAHTGFYARAKKRA